MEMKAPLAKKEIKYGIRRRKLSIDSSSTGAFGEFVVLQQCHNDVRSSFLHITNRFPARPSLDMAIISTLISICAPVLWVTLPTYLPSQGLESNRSLSQPRTFTLYILHRSDSLHLPHPYIRRLFARHTLDHAYGFDLEDILLAWCSL